MNQPYNVLRCPRIHPPVSSVHAQSAADRGFLGCSAEHIYLWGISKQLVMTWVICALAITKKLANNFISNSSSSVCPICPIFAKCSLWWVMWNNGTEPLSPLIYISRQILNVRNNKLKSDGFKIWLIMQTVFVPFSDHIQQTVAFIKSLMIYQPFISPWFGYSPF